MRKPSVYYFVVLLVSVLLLSDGCSSSDGPKKEPSASIAANVVARVGSELITEDALNREIERIVGVDTAKQVDASLRVKVLNSLLQRKAVVLAAEKELTQMERLELEEQVARYRSQELTKLYLRKHTQPHPVTEEMVLNYYLANPKLFGGVQVKHYEMIISSANVTDEMRSAAAEAMSALRELGDWTSAVSAMKLKGVKARLQSGRADDQMLHERLRAAMKDLGAGQTSTPVTIGNNLYLIRMIDESLVGKRTLDDVRDEIRQQLATDGLKKSIEQASELAVKEMKVEILKDFNF